MTQVKLQQLKDKAFVLASQLGLKLLYIDKVLSFTGKMINDGCKHLN